MRRPGPLGIQVNYTDLPYSEMGVSENRGHQYSTLSRRLLMITKVLLIFGNSEMG